MNFIDLKDFFAYYSLPVIIIAVVVVIICFVVNHFTKNKFNALLRAQFPFVLSVVIYVIYDMICKKAFVITDDSLYLGVLCGSLAGIINSVIKRISAGKTICLTPSALLIENILSGYFSDKSITDTANKIDKLMSKHLKDMDKSAVVSDIAKLLDHSNGKFLSADESLRIALLIYDAVKKLTNS